VLEIVLTIAHGGNRKKVVVDPDMLIVAPPMPRLMIKLDGFPQSVLEGEIIPLVLRVQNLSAFVPATRIRVAFSHLPFFVFDKKRCTIPGVEAVKEPVLLDSDQAVLAAMGDDAFSSLTWFDINGLEVPPNGVAEIPFLFRPYGNQHSRYLFHTAVAYRSSDSTNSAVRFAHAHNEVIVKPSIRIHQQIIPTPGSINSMLLRIRVDNIMRSRSLSIKQLSYLSRRWKISPIVDKSKMLFNVKPGESVNYVFRMVGELPVDITEPESFLHACDMTCCTNGDQQIDILHDSSMLFICSETNAGWEAGEFGHPPKTKGNQKRNSSNDDDNHESAAFGLSSFGALPSFVNAHLRADDTVVTKIPDLDVITLNWNVEGDSSGNVLPGAGLNLVAQQASEVMQNWAGLNQQCPVRICLNAPSTYKHNFTSEPLCMVPVTITTRNYSTSRRVRINFDALVPNNSSSEWQSTTAKSSSYSLWAGLSDFSMESLLEPFESRSEIIHACFSRPGLYALNSIRVTVSDNITGALLHSFVLHDNQCIIDVQSA